MTDDKINDTDNVSSQEYWRINMYHKTFEECMAHALGIHSKLKSLAKF